ncbi:MAG: hypothetical protein ACTSUH_04460, partial [Candidatus Thorarchaeota archaeon]
MKNDRMISIVMIALFAASMLATPTIMLTNSTPSKTGDELVAVAPVPPGARLADDIPDNYTHVQWEQGRRSEAWNDTYSWDYWQFGPSITWKTINATTGIPIEFNDTIAIDGWVNFVVKIPKNALQGKTPWGVLFTGTWVNLSAYEEGPREGEPEPGPGGDSPVTFIAIYEIGTARWHLYSTKMMSPMSPPDEPPSSNWTLEDYFGPQVDPFMEINDLASGYYPGAQNVWVQFQLKFNSSAEIGVYKFHAEALDTTLQPLAQSSDDEMSMRVVGMSFEDALLQVIGGYYTVTRVDDDGNFLYSATRGVDFNMTFDVTCDTPDNITVFMNIPNRVIREVVVDGPYTIVVNRTGGWDYDSTTGTYVWDASLETTMIEERWGPHNETVEDWLDLSMKYEVYDPWAGTMVIHESWPELALIYFFGNSSFAKRLAYRIDEFVDDDFGGHYEQRLLLKPYPTDGSMPIVYELNATGSSATSVLGRYHHIVFRGHITEDVQPTGGEMSMPMYLNPRVYSTDGKELPMYQWLPFFKSDDASYKAFFELAVETPVAVVRLIPKGEPYRPNWMFATDHNKTFLVKARLQGGASYASDIDGVAFVMRGWQDTWGEDNFTSWSQHSDVEVWVKADPAGNFETIVYNYTQRTQYVYGDTWEWQYIEVFPGYWDWQYVHTTSWHWETLIWDFEAGNWTTDWVPYHSNQTIMNANYVLAGNLTYSVIGNDLSVTFEVTPTNNMPELEWNWDYYFANLTWVTDYESGWGEHTVVGWTQDYVYSYLNGSQRVYVDRPYKS